MSIMTVVGTACIFSGAIFGFLDLVENNYLLTLGALCISIFVGWIWGIDKFVETANIKSKFFKVWLKVTVGRSTDFEEIKEKAFRPFY